MDLLEHLRVKGILIKIKNTVAPIKVLSPEAKRDVILQLGKLHNCRVLIETGTYKGETVQRLINDFEKIISIELSKELCLSAKKMFAEQKKVQILCGDSKTLLPKVLDELDEPAIFWLDAHYSGGITAKAEEDSVVSWEIAEIIKHRNKNHVILIDDARLFKGRDGYPTLSEVKKVMTAAGYAYELKDDIIRAYKT